MQIVLKEEGRWIFKNFWGNKKQRSTTKAHSPWSFEGQVSLTAPKVKPTVALAESERLTSSQPTSQGAESVISKEVRLKRKKE